MTTADMVILGEGTPHTGQSLVLVTGSYIHAHPTQSEAPGEAHLAPAGKPLHTHA
ncbi:hypothetical protein ABZ547_24810 [Streptomyces sparsogenes]|uniref:hypothetical protein n=1 Tax=Streptomyces sparsogenes TaxID=67365 RepID=UPI0033E8ABF3